jgi:hypothetical protein
LACQDIIPNNSQQAAEKITLDRLPRVKIAREQQNKINTCRVEYIVSTDIAALRAYMPYLVAGYSV